MHSLETCRRRRENVVVVVVVADCVVFVSLPTREMPANDGSFCSNECNAAAAWTVGLSLRLVSFSDDDDASSLG